MGGRGRKCSALSLAWSVQLLSGLQPCAVPPTSQHSVGSPAARFPSPLLLLPPSQQVVALHEVMLASGLTPDAPTASLVLSAALAAGQTRKALALANSLQVGGWGG